MADLQYAYDEYLLQPCRVSGSNAGTTLCKTCHPKQRQWCKDNQAIIKRREKLRQGRSPNEQHEHDNEQIIAGKMNTKYGGKEEDVQADSIS